MKLLCALRLYSTVTRARCDKSVCVSTPSRTCAPHPLQHLTFLTAATQQGRRRRTGERVIITAARFKKKLSKKEKEMASSPPSSGLPPRAPSRENRTLKRVMSIPSVDELGQVLAKADGKDRVVGLLQYIALFASGGRPGPLTSIGLGQGPLHGSGHHSPPPPLPRAPPAQLKPPPSPVWSQASHHQTADRVERACIVYTARLIEEPLTVERMNE